MPSQTSTTERRGLEDRVKWLVVFRLAIAAVLVLATLIVRPGAEPSVAGAGFVTVLTVTLMNFGMAVMFGLLFQLVHLKKLATFAFLQIVWDILLTTSLVYITGGISSDFKPMYWLSIVNASALLFRRGGFSAAALSAILYGTLVDLEFYGVIAPFGLAGSGAGELLEAKVISSIVLNTVGFFGWAYGSSSFAVWLRRAEEMLAEKSLDLEDLEDLMGRIVESLSSGLVTVDPDGRISYWNRGAEEITKLVSSEVRGKRFSDLFPQAPEKLLTEVEKTSREGGPWRWEMEFRRPEGGLRRLGFSVSALAHGEHGKRGTLVIFQDLTKFREMEEQVKKADRLAAVGELAARMAHEIRNPLTSVSGAIEVLRSQLKLEEQDLRLMEIVLKETDRLNLLLTDFLIFAKPTPPQFEEVAVGQLVEETTSLFTKSHREGGAKVNLRIEGEVALRGDPKRLSQMIWNLLKNASEAMGGEGEIDVSLGRNGGGGEVILEVRDRGPGISPEIRDRLFQPFVTTKTRGTGLGLAMVRRIADEHGGTVTVESGAEWGTKFQVHFPLPAEALN